LKNSIFEKKGQMKKIICLFLFAFIQNAYCQNEELPDLTIEIHSANYYKDKFGSTDLKFQPDQNSCLRLHDIYIRLLINSSKPDILIDLNNFSLVENELKLRLRPNKIEYRDVVVLPKFDLKEIRREDTFLKYSQEGITNIDYYYPVNSTWKNIFKRSFQQQERFHLFVLPLKKKKWKNRFDLEFSVDYENSGEFSLYYKDQLIKTFILKRGEYLKF
jgi:hypothetical protein